MIPWFHTKWGLLKKVQHGVKTGIKKSRPGRASHRIKKGVKTESKQGPKKVQKESNKQLKGIEKESNINPNCCTMLLVFSDIW